MPAPRADACPAKAYRHFFSIIEYKQRRAGACCLFSRSISSCISKANGKNVGVAIFNKTRLDVDLKSRKFEY